MVPRSGLGCERGALRGPARPYEAAASHAEPLRPRAAGRAVQDAAEAVVEGVALGQAVEVALVGRWGREECGALEYLVPRSGPSLLLLRQMRLTDSAKAAHGG